jgi:hypothetical protein
VERIPLAQDRVQWLVLVNTVIKQFGLTQGVEFPD